MKHATLSIALGCLAIAGTTAADPGSHARSALKLMPPMAPAAPSSPPITVTVPAAQARTYCSDYEAYITIDESTVSGKCASTLTGAPHTPTALIIRDYPSERVPHVHKALSVLPDGAGGEVPAGDAGALDRSAITNPDGQTGDCSGTTSGPGISDFVWEANDRCDPPYGVNSRGDAFAGYFDAGDYQITATTFAHSISGDFCQGILRYAIPAPPQGPKSPLTLKSAALKVIGQDYAIWGTLAARICKPIPQCDPANGGPDPAWPTPCGCIVSSTCTPGAGAAGGFSFVNTHDVLIQEDVNEVVGRAGLSALTDLAGCFNKTIPLGQEVVDYINAGGNAGVIDFMVGVGSYRAGRSEGTGAGAVAFGVPANFVVLEDENNNIGGGACNPSTALELTY